MRPPEGMLGRSGSVVAAVATGEDTFDDAFEAGRALGQGLDVVAKARDVGLDFSEVSADFIPNASYVIAHFFPEALHVGAKFLPVALHVGAEFGSQVSKSRAHVANFRPDLGDAAVGVGTRVAPDGDHEAGQGNAHSQDCDEFGCHGRLPGVGV